MIFAKLQLQIVARIYPYLIEKMILLKIIKHYAKKIVILQNIYMIQVKRFDLVILKQIYPQFQILKLIKLNFLIVSLI